MFCRGLRELTANQFSYDFSANHWPEKQLDRSYMCTDASVRRPGDRMVVHVHGQDHDERELLLS